MAEQAHTPGHCTCRYDRDFDGSEFGPCAYCEFVSDEEAEQKRLRWDALRWRFTQRPGFRKNMSYEFSETEGNKVVVYLGNSKVGVGITLQDAVDCGLFLTAEYGDDVPFATFLQFWRDNFRSYLGGEPRQWLKPPPPQFDLSDDGGVCLSGASIVAIAKAEGRSKHLDATTPSLDAEGGGE